MKNLLILFFAALILASCSSSPQPKTIYIVRHAEKMLVEDKDPELAQVGYVRAKKLAQILEDEEIKHIFSTDYKRTRQTAQPTAEAAGIEIQSYDPTNQEGFAKQLQSLEGNILVVGHSNTVSKLANYFVEEGEKFADLEDVEYDFIYEVKIDKSGSTVTRKLYKEY
ncbi:phosphoglycerate mutase family protein [Algoriphagus sp. CAU 1675]|uniref:SixA phosphatase family protein n=1 Tax=Algoriphagus sp. CAU 1675 TaxID=3032597 RepID=UPI0023DCDA99|nr:phosphoglycerate mutase family protein [Algoriphagus sp. CAU 1675]MDF2158848.1 phosphoglycerate mutase family protein [Algoriphagus sp. CAU 1675]